MNISLESLKSILENPNIKQILNRNPPGEMLFVLTAVCVLCVVVHIASGYVQQRIERFVNKNNCRLSIPGGRGATSSDDGAKTKTSGPGCMDLAMFGRVFKGIKRFLYFGVLYWGVDALNLPPAYARAATLLFNILCAYAGVVLLSALAPFILDLYLRRHGATLGTSRNRAILPIMQSMVWALGFTFLLDNLGFQVSTIIAGLGIMGVAVGLAGQAILSDFFSYLVILLDRPFRIGDYVELADGRAGDVEYVGLKTTRLRNLDEDFIVCANSEMTKGLITNQGNIRERKVVTNLGITYETSMEKLRAIPNILHEIIESFPECRFNRACFLDYGDSSLKYQLVYFVKERRGGIVDFMNTRSEVNLSIKARFDAQGIDFAYPTSTIYLNRAPDSAPPAQSNAVPKGQAGSHFAPESGQRPENRP